MGKAYLKVSRESNFIGSIIKFDVYVNDNKVGTIANNQVKTFRVSTGSLSVQLRWQGENSKTLSLNDLDEDETIKVVCKAKMGALRNGIEIWRDASR